MRYAIVLVLLAGAAIPCHADGVDTKAVVGGAIGGGAGAAVGSAVGGREGAIIGGAIGGGVGAAVATAGDKEKETVVKKKVVVHKHYYHKHDRGLHKGHHKHKRDD